MNEYIIKFAERTKNKLSSTLNKMTFITGLNKEDFRDIMKMFGEEYSIKNEKYFEFGVPSNNGGVCERYSLEIRRKNA